LAKALNEKGNLKKAEKHFILANEPMAAVEMYRREDKWDEAYMLAQRHVPALELTVKHVLISKRGYTC